MNSDYEGAVLAASCGRLLHFWRPLYDETVQKHKAIPFDHTVTSVAWNRNNKVIAVASDDGNLELRYNNGDPMNSLPFPVDGTSSGESTRVNCLSWSQGSKRLAAGRQDGIVLLHDLKEKACTSHRINATNGPIMAIEHQTEDAYLAIAGDGVTLHDPKTCMQFSRLPRPRTSSFGGSDATELMQRYNCLSINSRDRAVAAGTTSGMVTVWDCNVSAVKWQYVDRRSGGLTATRFVPLEPSMLWTAGADGELVLFDIRDGGSVHKISSRISIGVPISALSVREASSHVAVGSADGMAYLYDPRRVDMPVTSLRCSESGSRPITALHWQQNYQNLLRRMTVDLEEADPVTKDACRYVSASANLKTAQGLNSSKSNKGQKESPEEKHTEAPDASMNIMTRKSGNTLAEKGSSFLEPPKRLDLTPLTSNFRRNEHKMSPQKTVREDFQLSRFRSTGHGSAENLTCINSKHQSQRETNDPTPKRNTVVDAAEALERFRRRQKQNTLSSHQKPDIDEAKSETSSGTASAAVSLEKRGAEKSRDVEDVDSRIRTRYTDEGKPIALRPEGLREHLREPGMRNQVKSPDKRLIDQGRINEPSRRTETAHDQQPQQTVVRNQKTYQGNWSIKAASRSFGRVSDDGGSSSAKVDQHVALTPDKPRQNPLSGVRSIEKTEAKFQLDKGSVDQEASPDSESGAVMGETSRPTASGATPSLISDIHNDILALHLDILNNFAEQREEIKSLVETVYARQDALAADVAKLQEQLSDLLSRREGALWL